MPSRVLFVGSVPLETNEKVFATLSAKYGDRLLALTDGETGERHNWIGWQIERLPQGAIKQEVLKMMNREIVEPLPHGHAGFTMDDTKPTDYDTAAIESYRVFRRLKDEGKIPPGVRLLVALPTPFAVVQGWCRADLVPQLEPLYEHRLIESLNRIVKTIPHEDLAIQWDIAVEMGVLEQERGGLADKFFEEYFDSAIPSPRMPHLVERVRRISAFVPNTVALGLHLCYGDWFNKHWQEPRDLGLPVDFANDIVKALSRPVDWVHMPVPKERDDEAYVAPAKGLKIGEAILILGLAHSQDEEGTVRKIKVAEKVLPFDFGVATECGLGRTPIERVESVLQILDKVTSNSR